ncbi:hypothetical protein SEA_SAMISTI12_46 [Streptomyces phage Samisti12]|uniref:Uncharacterized protein n=6 Tax=Samistivirus TaxID=2560220 RepID=A0A223FZV4_9CAUD|nr:hypothetical protein FDI38_gp219 [Streptomyces phage Peebs]YP_009611484.1 hypothetical protein FDI39_gp218 [Streptomyces phage Samisti12]YP_010101467.1 hypothetical protein KNU49_gp221 [Streptomyces phage EGole]ASR76478.1 hypothetical protein SEA_SUSHI23_46 [Streptomyces phage Sushi23]QGH78236.1 hypothetical protein SEA_TRIBUTE_44 [Streptomyces phage Tribute]QRI46041.1 hypothetical protein SEA_CROSS_46 [Streptomyces phage Cross]WDS51842.1 hypothetical protein SEA_PEPPERWOOD_46 [Streptomyce
MKKTNIQTVEEAAYGVYVWEMPNGQWVGDDEGNFLSIAAMKGDLKRLNELTEAARHYGIMVGKPLFLSGHRKVDDEEFEYQKQRQAFGLIPDENDIPALVSEQIYKERNDQ